MIGRQRKKVRVWAGFGVVLGLCVAALPSHAAKVETIPVPSKAMDKTYNANVVLPDSYAQKTTPYPVLYLLHGGFGHYDDWLNKTPDKTLVQTLSDRHDIIIVMPEGETLSWYLDSPINPKSQFETYIAREVIPKIDATYRTIASNKGRVITGLSMGGHGALLLATRHPQLFAAAGSMSGALDIDKIGKDRVEPILGPRDANLEKFTASAVVNMTEQMKTNALPLIVDCGVDDFLIEHNRELHKRLVAGKTPHDYTERPGGHTWEYWQNALPYHLMFFDKILRTNAQTPK